MSTTKPETPESRADATIALQTKMVEFDRVIADLRSQVSVAEEKTTALAAKIAKIPTHCPHCQMRLEAT